jgi:hypothetical protein
MQSNKKKLLKEKMFETKQEGKETIESNHGVRVHGLATQAGSHRKPKRRIEVQCLRRGTKLHRCSCCRHLNNLEAVAWKRGTMKGLESVRPVPQCKSENNFWLFGSSRGLPNGPPGNKEKGKNFIAVGKRDSSSLCAAEAALEVVRTSVSIFNGKMSCGKVD